MPGGNGTGPAGMGPMTGRGAGFCAGYSVPGYANPVGGGGMGMGRGRGGGRGWRNQYYPAPRWAGYYGPTMAAAGPENELQALQSQAEAMKANLEQISERIAQLETEKK
jgi:hypothetical protein